MTNVSQRLSYSTTGTLTNTAKATARSEMPTFNISEWGIRAAAIASDRNGKLSEEEPLWNNALEENISQHSEPKIHLCLEEYSN